MNANAEILATENLQIVPSIRIEKYDTDSLAEVMETNANGRGVDSFEETQTIRKQLLGRCRRAARSRVSWW